jgi:hypothetical protein
MSFIKKDCMDYGYPTQDYIDTCKMPSGQTLKIEFQEDYNKNRYLYNVYFAVMDKRKSESNVFLRTTGKDGLKSLIWAKNKIIEFEEFIKTEFEGSPPITIYLQWDDNRRRNVYEHGLKKLGYKFGMVAGKKALYKTF